MPTFVCPLCARTVQEEPLPVTTDSRSNEEAADAIGETRVAAPPACQDGHPPVQMHPEGSR